MAKGDLPINTAVVLIVGVIVLLAIIVFFMGVVNPPSAGLSGQSDLQTRCNRLVAASCPSPSWVYFQGLSNEGYDIAKQKAGLSPDTDLQNFATNEEGDTFWRKVCDCPT